MPVDNRALAQDILRGVSGALTSLAPLFSGGWRDAVSFTGHAVAFVSDLLAHDLDPGEAITEIRSVLPDYDAAKARLQQLIDERSR